VVHSWDTPELLVDRQEGPVERSVRSAVTGEITDAGNVERGIVGWSVRECIRKLGVRNSMPD
jgi:hypothetical protein